MQAQLQSLHISFSVSSVKFDIRQWKLNKTDQSVQFSDLQEQSFFAQVKETLILDEINAVFDCSESAKQYMFAGHGFQDWVTKASFAARIAVSVS